jgi:(p)ppGpp synthase/HD superfamily hydrolase
MKNRGNELLGLNLDGLRGELDDVIDKLPKEARPELSKALELAEEAHSGQVRDDGTLYIAHPLRVTLSLALELDVWDADLLCAALLHDALEDGKQVTFVEIRKDFGERVAHTVQNLTKPSDSEQNREHINRQYLDRLRRADEDCKLVKLADKLDNVRDAVNSPDAAKRRRTAAEAREFYLVMARSLSDVQHRQTILALLQDAIKTLEDQTALD